MPLVSKAFGDIITFTRASTGTYFDATGTLQTAATDVPRFDYDPSTLAAQGLLIEEARTNGAIWSESFRTRTLTVTITGGTFTNGETVTATGGGTGTYIAADSTPTSFAIFNGSGTFSGTLTGGTSGATATISASTAAWANNNSTISANAAVAPTGATVADKLVENTATSTHRLNQTVTGTTNTNAYTVSVFAKADTRTRLYVAQVEGATFVRQGNAVFDLSAGTVVSATTGLNGATGGSATIQNVGNGWYRCTYTLTLGGTDTSILFDFQLVSTGTTNNYTGDGTSGLFLWGAQLEAGAFPTSYIPTTTTGLTRNADVASVNTLSPWYNATEGTLFGEVSYYGQLIGSAAETNAFGLDDGTSTNLMRLRIVRDLSSPQADVTVVASSVNQMDTIGLQPAVANTVYKRALAYALNNAIPCINGSLDGSVDTSFNVPSVNRLVLSYGASVAMYIRRITYYPRRLSNAELVSITS